jgi:cystathionine beta-lyase
MSLTAVSLAAQNPYFLAATMGAAAVALEAIGNSRFTPTSLGALLRPLLPSFLPLQRSPSTLELAPGGFWADVVGMSVKDEGKGGDVDDGDEASATAAGSNASADKDAQPAAGLEANARTFSPATALLHPQYRAPTGFVGLAEPVVRASTRVFESAAQYRERKHIREDDYAYATAGTPITRQLAHQVAEIEGGINSVLATSGLSAITTAMLGALSAGDHQIVDSSVSAPVRDFCDDILARMGIATTYVDPMDMDAIRDAIQPNTRLVWGAAPHPTTYEVPDIGALAELAHANGALFAVDNSWSAGWFCKPFEHGADISVQSLTEHQGGQGEVEMGAATVRDEALWERIRTASLQLGVCVGGDDASTVLRGMKTLRLRLEEGQASGLDLARWLQDRPEVAQVLHPALPSCPGHENWLRYFTGSTGAFSFVLDPQLTQSEVDNLVNDMRAFQIGSSWDRVDNLIMSPAKLPEERMTRLLAPGHIMHVNVRVEEIGAEDSAAVQAEQERATRQLAQRVAAIEGGTDAVLAPSGLNAITTAMLGALAAGDHQIVVSAVYPPVRRFCDDMLVRMGIATTYVDPMDMDAIRRAMRPETRLIWGEAPCSTTYEVPDIGALAELAHANGALFAVDNSWSAGRFFQPFEHGADISVQALTKYQGGHGDLLMGATIVRDEALWERIHAASLRLGVGVGSDDVRLVQRGLETLGLRLKEAQTMGLGLARWLQDRPEVVQVLHPALPSCPGHENWLRYFTGSTGAFSFILDPRFTQADVDNMVNGMEIFRIGGSWGGVDSLILSPAKLPEDRMARFQASGHIVRINVGLEGIEDLRRDLASGLERLARGTQPVW